jgi:hypothetical protein
MKIANPFVYFELLTSSYILVQFEGDYFAPAWDTNETFDGSRWEKPAMYSGDLLISSDTRQPVVLNLENKATFGADGSLDAYAKVQAALQVDPRLELSLTPEVGVTSATRFYSCTAAAGTPCTADDAARRYRFARLDSSFLSLTLRGSWTFSPTLTLQAYGQLFMATGIYSDFRDVDAIAARATLRRRDLVPVDFASERDFQSIALNLNLVVRWEFQPGSTVIGVFTRSEIGTPELGGARPALLRLGGLSQGPTEDVLLLKLVLFLSS